MANLTGTPLNSYSANLNPGLWVSLSSNLTEIPFASNSVLITATCFEI